MRRPPTTLVSLLLLIPLLLLASCLGQVSVVSYAVTVVPVDPQPSNDTAVFECLSAISFRLCSGDLSCQSRFYLDYYTTDDIRKSNFDYQLRIYLHLPPVSVAASSSLASSLIPGFSSLTPLVSPGWILAQLATNDLTDVVNGSPFLLETDGLFGSHCATNVQSFIGNSSLWINTTATGAQLGRVWWLYALRKASFCTENEVFDESLGCVCRPGKICDEADTSQYLYAMPAITIMLLVIFGVVLWKLTFSIEQARGVLKTTEQTGRTARTLINVLQEVVLAPLPAAAVAAAAGFESSSMSTASTTTASSQLPIKSEMARPAAPAKQQKASSSMAVAPPPQYLQTSTFSNAHAPPRYVAVAQASPPPPPSSSYVPSSMRGYSATVPEAPYDVK